MNTHESPHTAGAGGAANSVVSRSYNSFDKYVRQHAFSEGSQFWSGGQRMRQDESVCIWETDQLITVHLGQARWPTNLQVFLGYHMRAT